MLRGCVIFTLVIVSLYEPTTCFCLELLSSCGVGDSSVRPLSSEKRKHVVIDVMSHAEPSFPNSPPWPEREIMDLFSLPMIEAGVKYTLRAKVKPCSFCFSKFASPGAEFHTTISFSISLTGFTTAVGNALNTPSLIQ